MTEPEPAKRFYYDVLRKPKEVRMGYSEMSKNLGLTAEKPKFKSIVVQLGRIGDILNIIPACKYLGLTTLLIGEEYRSLVKAFPYLKFLLWRRSIEDLKDAVEMAQTLAETVYVPQLFGLKQPEGMPPRKRPSFVQDQWDRLKLGFGDKWGTLPLSIPYRLRYPNEQQLIQQHLGNDPRPALLVNLQGISGPYPYRQELAAYVNKFADKVRLVDLSQIPVQCITDFLGLYEHAAGLLTIDTSHLHLARALPTFNVFQLLRPGVDGTPPMYPNTLGYDDLDFSPIGEWISKLRMKMPVTMEATSFHTVIGLEISMKIGCSQACTHCPQDVLAKRYHGAREFTLESFQHLLRSVPTWRDLAFTGFSEAFNCKAALDCMEWAFNRGHRCTISTTLRGLDKPGVDRMITWPWKHIVLHLPSDQGEMRGQKIDDDYLELVRYAVDKWRIHPQFIPQCHYPKTDPRIQKIFDDANIIIPGGGLHDRAGILSSLPLYHGRRQGVLPLCGKQFCGNLLPNGEVYLCCNDYGLKHCLGNLNTDDYLGIFKRDPFQQLIRDQQDPNSDAPLCRNCHDCFQQGWDPDHLPKEVFQYPTMGVRGVHELGDPAKAW